MASARKTGDLVVTGTDAGSKKTIDVAIYNAAGTHVDPSTAGGGVQYTEGDTDSSITGTAILWEDAADTLRPVSSAKPLPVNIVAGSASGTEYTEDAAAAADPAGGALILVRADSLAAITSTDGDNVATRGTNKGEIYVKHVDAIPVTDNAGSLTVDGTVTANLAAGTNNIGDVDVLSIAAGDNNIGNVDVVTLPATPAGTNVIGGIRQAGFQNAVWDVQHVPAANTQATATQAAGGEGIKNVCTGFTVTLAAGASAPTAAAPISVAVIDGATGGGTYLWRSIINIPATTGTMVSIVRGGLWLEGTANTQMTIEFSAAGGANTYESVTMEGTTI